MYAELKDILLAQTMQCHSSGLHWDILLGHVLYMGLK